MSENRRLDWDILLQQDPANPPIRTETRPETINETEPEPQATRLMEVEIEPEFADIETQIQPEVPATQPKNSVPPQQAKKQQGLGILEGNVTPNAIVNAFILSEIFGKPKGMRRRGRR